MRNGGWLQTATGGRFYPLDPVPDEVMIEDIAAALSKICRFGGHCKRFYSVAEHSILAARLVPEEHKLAALLHDASEAYLSDIPRPVKKLLPDYQKLEDSLMLLIAEKFGFQWPPHISIKEADIGLLFTEREHNMEVPAGEWENERPPLDLKLSFLTPWQAEDKFLEAFKGYYHG